MTANYMSRMTNILKPYAAYKDSGVPWLGQVPAHWEVRRIKTLFRETDERNGNGGGLLLSLTRTRGIVPQSEAANRIASVEDLSNYKVCKSGDLIMNRMQAWSGMFAVSGIDGVISPDYSVFQPKAAIEVHYFEALFKTPALVDEFAKRSKGIGSGFNRLYTPDFGAVPIASPPLKEQTAIVRFLDYMDRRIRRYIRAKQKRIKLLEEYKQALIHQAVTGQIDVQTGQPYPAYKPSGVEWLGQVPEHWEVRRLGSVTQILNGATPSSSRPEYWDGDIVWVTPEDLGKLKGRYIDNSSRRITQEGYNACGTTLAPAGSIVLSTRAPIGHLGILRVAACANQGCRLLVPQAATASEFLYHMLVAARPSLEVLGQGSTFLELSRSKLGAFPIPFPPLPEQTAIVRFLDEQTAKIDTATAAARREIELLREYRTRLFADAVTGKVDVREVAAQLPEEPEIPEQEEPLVFDDEPADREPEEVQHEESPDGEA